MAGAEGIEPLARGFGVDVEKDLHRNAFRSFQPLADFRQFALLRFDAIAYNHTLTTQVVRDTNVMRQSIPGYSNFASEKTENRDLKQQNQHCTF